MAAEDDDLSALLFETTGAYDGSTLELFDEVSVVLFQSVESTAGRTEFSSEELAWADSCLDIKLSAILEALSFFPASNETSSANHVDEEIEKSDDAENDPPSEDASDMLIDPEEQHSSDDESQKEFHQMMNFNQMSSSESQEDIVSPETIFKVWDLEIPESDDEEDELIQQLKKLLAGSSSQEVLLPPPDYLATALSKENVDELITSMGDLSLKHFD